MVRKGLVRLAVALCAFGLLALPARADLAPAPCTAAGTRAGSAVRLALSCLRGAGANGARRLDLAEVCVDGHCDVVRLVVCVDSQLGVCVGPGSGTDAGVLVPGVDVPGTSVGTQSGGTYCDYEGCCVDLGPLGNPCIYGDAFICPLLITFAPTVNALPGGLVYIDPATGDTYVGGTAPEDLFWDCPPYVV